MIMNRVAFSLAASILVLTSAPAHAERRLYVSASQSQSSAPSGKWNEQSLAFLDLAEGDRAFAVALHRLERFGHAEHTVSSRFDGAGANNRWHVALAGSPDARFRPVIQLQAGLVHDSPAVGPITLPSLSGRVSQYQNATTVQVVLGATMRSEQMGLQTTGRLVFVGVQPGGAAAGVDLELSMLRETPFQISLGVACIPEFDGDTVIAFESIRASLAADLSDNVRARLVVTFERRPAFERQELAIILARRF